jgi:D-glycero-D-manno-heptose 1,7-bisphosphate phosphatase
MLPAVFLDRDGVLIENRADYVRDWSQVAIFPNIFSALASLRLAGYKIVLVTNQSAIGRGLISLQTANEINQKLVDVIQSQGGHVDAIYLCPHHPEEGCLCRKPKPGLLLQAAEELSLDLSRSWMIGDAWSDLLAGQAAKLHGVAMVRTGRGNEQLLQPKPEEVGAFHIFNSISEAAQAILSKNLHTT